MNIERFDELERSVLKMENTVGSLADKMSDVATSLNTMSKAVSKLALYDLKIERIEKDITNVADSVRRTNERITSLHSSHTEHCSTKLEDTSRDFNKLSLTRFLMGVSAATFLFGYLWVQLHDAQMTNEKISKALTFTKIRVEKLKGEINVLNEKCDASK